MMSRPNVYALAAGAAGVSVLALAQASEGEVVLTGANINIGHNGYYAMDLNHDGITDFTVQNTFAGTPPAISETVWWWWQEPRGRF
jgi:hypothetical protein